MIITFYDVLFKYLCEAVPCHTSEGPDVRRSGCPKVRSSEGLYYRNYILAHYYIFMTDNGNIVQPLCPHPPQPKGRTFNIFITSWPMWHFYRMECLRDNATRTFHFKLFTNSTTPPPLIGGRFFSYFNF